MRLRFPGWDEYKINSATLSNGAGTDIFESFLLSKGSQSRPAGSMIAHAKRGDASCEFGCIQGIPGGGLGSKVALTVPVLGGVPAESVVVTWIVMAALIALAPR